MAITVPPKIPEKSSLQTHNSYRYPLPIVPISTPLI